MQTVSRFNLKALYIAVIVFIASFWGCAFAPEPEQNGYSSGSTEDLELRSIFRQPYMGGSVVYDPERGENSQLVPGAAIAVRLGYVKREGDALNGHYKNDTARPTHYGYIRVSKIDSNSIEFSYTLYSSIGSRVTTDHSLKQGDTLDLNYDGIPDLAYSPPPLKRAAMPKAVYLTFLSAKDCENTSLFSVLPSQYAADEHPNGLLGVNPDGKFVFTMLKQKGFEMEDITDAVVNDKHEKHAVMGMQPGDYVLVPNSYTTDAEGEPMSGKRGGYKRVTASAKGLYQTRSPINEDHLDYSNVSSSVGFSEHDFEDLQDITAKDLYNAIPSVSSKPSASADTAAAYIAALNALLESRTAISEIRTAKPSLVFDSGTEAQLDLIIKELPAADTAEDDESDEDDEDEENTVHQVKAANRFFLTLAFPEYCPPSTIIDGQNFAEVHPLFWFNYSGEDNLGSDTVSIPNSSTKIDGGLLQGMAGGALSAAANPSYDAKYSEYVTKRTSTEDTFNKEFAGRFGLDSTSLVGKVAPFISPEATLKIGINCAVSCWWGKLELAAGAAIFIKAEITLGEGGAAVNEKSIFDLTKSEKPIQLFKATRQFMIGGVELDVEIGTQLDFSISLGSNLAASDALFAGFCGLYGAKAAVGVNYGVKWKWGFIPVGLTFDPYAKATVYNQSANYAGRKFQGSGVVSIISFKATPKLTFYVKPALWGVVWTKAANTLSFPAAYTCDTARNPMNKLSIDIDYKLAFSAGLQIDIKIWRRSYTLAEYELIHEQKNIYKKDW
ncbi:MAG: hypothetical protein Ta2B_07300 [Termitinemataceae bacterium]|nr:MAG: hypothetical protein Ta2B_07300 [Termitinemataceae bacterium]